MRVLVTGAAGFIGYHVSERLLARGDEVIGLERLRELAEALYGQRDPAQIFWRGRTQRVERSGDGYLLRLPLPFTEKGDIKLVKLGDELVIQVGQHKRKLVLPRVLVGMETAGAKLEADELQVRSARP